MPKESVFDALIKALSEGIELTLDHFAHQMKTSKSHPIRKAAINSGEFSVSWMHMSHVYTPQCKSKKVIWNDTAQNWQETRINKKR